jgi:hypothetical protein
MYITLWLSDKFKTPLASKDFIQGMLNRCIHSGYKHGGEKKGGVRNWIPRLEDSLREYKETGNVERLLDVANYAMYEASLPDHPAAHFRCTDSRGFRKISDF